VLLAQGTLNIIRVFYRLVRFDTYFVLSSINFALSIIKNLRDISRYSIR